MRTRILLMLSVLSVFSEEQVSFAFPNPNENTLSKPSVHASCSTSARNLQESILIVQCPSECQVNGRTVWGTDVYTDDSSICKAAIHAGILGNNGGLVTVGKRPGQQSYSGSARNGVTTINYGSWPGSFVFHGSPKPPTPKPTEVPTQKPPVNGSCSTSARDLQESISIVQCPSECQVNGGIVWGTDVYTDDSSICKAAIHAGILGNNGGLVTVGKTPGQQSYSGSARNGVTTINYGSWPGSFVFHGSPKPPTPKPTEVPTQKPPVIGSCSTSARNLQESISIVQCPSECQVNGGTVWGTDVYTDNSSICKAAIHAGILGNNGGLVTVGKTPGQQSYSGSARNGVTTINYGSWSGSFVFHGSPKPPTPKPTEVPTQKPPVNGSCSSSARNLQESISIVQCPSECQVNGGTVWGTDVYTDDSSICKAAIHAGILGNNGGLVTVGKRPGQQSYSGSARNGVTTINYGSWPGSFVFHGSPKPPTPKPTEVPTQKPPVNGSCSTTARNLQESISIVQCPSECQVNGGIVWGTDVYTDDSSICKAAIHAGILGNNGGLVTVGKTPGQQSYRGSTRNGVTTINYGSWPGSFVFHGSPKPPTPKPTEVPTQKPPVNGSCSTSARNLQESISIVQCPSECQVNGGTVWGTDVYTDDSSICKAAIHAGILGNNGGLVTVGKRPGQQSYSGSARNGVTTINYGSWPGSFVFHGSPKPPTPKPTEVPTQKPPVNGSCSTTARDLQESISIIQCPSECQVNGGTVWGTDVYTDDSSICKAAIHAGILGNNGGLVTVEKTPGQQSYNGSARNGVTTINYGSWPGSFVFHVTSKPPTPKPTEVPTQKPPGSLLSNITHNYVQATCSTAIRDLQDSIALVQCPSDCMVNGRNVWGTDVYTDDSSICKAAIHAGILGNNGGLVTVEKNPGQQSYSGSTRNGVTTSNYGAWSGSFVFRASSKPPISKPTIVPTQKPPVQATCSTTARDLQDSIALVQCPSDCTVNGRNVWGTDVYTDDSSICKAAINAGILGNNGGLVTVEKTPGLSSYTGSTRNGVTTNNYGSWTGSFVLRGTSKTPTPKPTKISTQKPPVQGTCATTARDLTGSITMVQCPSDCLVTGQNIWGTYIYTDDSSICKAAIHAGILENNGGLVAVKKIPGQSSYSGSSRNGITSNNYGYFSGSFIF
ncbi:uncharacterized protein LOC120945822 [Rana temporaria]|uniref:uncharacterized protein LOC120945822 n=1 Tax=Rana temporaria TaxID=8407 RepID=UPI001AAC5363|nr:uncharacterized protein LOC120945822 [Rana temporaria]